MFVVMASTERQTSNQGLDGSQGPRTTWAAWLLCLIAPTVLRYRIRMDGVKAIKAKGAGGILFLPNHPALIAPVKC